MLAKAINYSARSAPVVITALALLLAVGAWAMLTLPIDALPDVSTIQVSVLTKAPGLSPVEVERTVTTPIENILNGMPATVQLRSVSRTGLSAVTAVFEDGTDVWFARQLVLERLRGVEAALPPSAETPELAPVSTGLGEIYQFVVRSDHHSPMQLRTILDWEIVPKLRQLDGVIEVNTMGGELKQYQVVVDHESLKLHHLTLSNVLDALRAANINVGGGYVDRSEEAYVVRGQGMLASPDEIGSVVLRSAPNGASTLVRHIAKVEVGPALRYGVITHNGKGEAVTGIAMMLFGANSRNVVRDVAARVERLRGELPPGVTIDTVYDRSDFVGRTIKTVAMNLLEGVLIVTLVLTLFLGSFRGALAVVLGIPASMSLALLGMHAFGVTGDLMSLGAIDFGFLVDGPIVILEGVIAATLGQTLLKPRERARFYGEVAGSVGRPVAFAVAIIMLVYVPLLGLQGVEGKMFRPMAITMACALLGALVYAVLFFPAVLVSLVPPSTSHGPQWLDRVSAAYERLIGPSIQRRLPILLGSAGALVLVSFAFVSAGAEFVPRIFEGDAVVTIRRAPSISLNEARDLDLAAERVLHGFPEVVTTLAMTGRAEVAIDPVGNDNTDILVRLRPLDDWRTAATFDDLSERIKTAVESRVPGTFVSVSQPIEDRTNELISGSRADVSVQIFGRDLDRLAALSNQVADSVRAIRGTGDVRVERVLGQPEMVATANRERMARYGVRVEDAFAVLAAAREGVTVGKIYEEQRFFDLRVLHPPKQPTIGGIGDLFVATSTGVTVPIREVVELTEGDGPTLVRRQDRERVIRVDVNLRGRDLVSWVSEAQARVAKSIPLASGYRVEWGGQFENFQRAKARLAVLTPLVVMIIFGMLLWMFGEIRFAGAVFVMVPLAMVGGMIGLLLRGLSFSLSAAVGFIALGGVAVLTGLVLASEVKRRLDDGAELDSAITHGSVHVLRAVLTTAAVAAFGFLPMALAESAGAEVQRPLATVVIVGIFFGTAATLFVLPGVLRMALRRYSQ